MSIVFSALFGIFAGGLGALALMMALEQFLLQFDFPWAILTRLQAIIIVGLCFALCLRLFIGHRSAVENEEQAELAQNGSTPVDRDDEAEADARPAFAFRSLRTLRQAS